MAELFTELKGRLTAEQGTATATIVQGPANLGARLLVRPDQSVKGSLKNTELQMLVIPDAVQAIWDGAALTKKYTLADETWEVFLEGFPPPRRLIIVGAGHISIPLTTFAKTLGYHVIIVDARSVFATRERFPLADEIIVEWPDTYLQSAGLNPATAVCVLTHDEKFDEPSLLVALNSNVFYIGAIGSGKTGTERLKRLRAQGTSEEQLARIHGPIGLKLGSNLPEVIALGIMAEIEKVRYATK